MSVQSCPHGILALRTPHGCLQISRSKLTMAVGQPAGPQRPGMEPTECTTAESGFETS